jgi:hypothetical protein
VLYYILKPNSSLTQSTFATHPWVLTDSQDNCISVFVAERGASHTVAVNG